MDTNESEQMRLLDPPADWQPDATAALVRLKARIEARPRAAFWWRWPFWVAAAILIASALWPAGRGVAQQLWQMFAVPKLAFVRVNAWPEGVPGPEIEPIGIPLPPQRVSDVDEARQRVRYEPRLPHSGVLSGSAHLTTTLPVAAGMMIRTADLARALKTVGVIDQTVPPQWDGARLTLFTGSLVIAEWPDVVLVQSPPLTLTTPPDFDFEQFSALILRVGGVSREDAANLAKTSDTIPPWLVPIPRELKAESTIEQIAVNSGTATLVKDGKRVTIMWTVPDRVYLLSGSIERGLAIAVANAVQ